MNDVAIKPNNSPEKQSRRAIFTPQVDIFEVGDEMVLQLDLPGVKGEDVEVHYERGELAVNARKHSTPRSGQGLVEEFESGDYYRAFLISQEVAADRITAELKHGVLTVRLPKHEAAKPRKVAVKVG